MIQRPHLLRPIRSARSVSRRGAAAIARWRKAWMLRGIRCAQRDWCWCGAALAPFPWHPSYGVCPECGCYVNRRPPRAEDMERLYRFDLYWHVLQRSRGYPPIEDRLITDRADGRIDFWLSLLARHGPPAGTAIEVGCAHGALLVELRARGYRCVGVEPDETTAQWVRDTTGLDVRAGFFPHVALPRCDLFLAFDVLEHSPDPLAFLRGAKDFLRRDGVAIIQTPINRYNFDPPFGDRFSDAFDDVQHLYLFTDKSLKKLADGCGLQIINNSERLWLHHEICVLRKA